MQQQIKVYTGNGRHAEFQRDAAKLARDGWMVAGQTDVQDKAGLGRMLAFGFIFAHGKRRLTVTYQKP